MVDSLSRFQPVLALISILGGLVILRLAYDCLRTRGITPESGRLPPALASLGKGVLVNLLSPHPWLFWFSVGAPMLLQAAAESRGSAGGFVAIFYLLLVGSKLLLARLVGRYRSLLSGNAYQWVMRLLGVFLVYFAFYFFRQGYALHQG
jgi:threonine/homoserine/homoserine lactone efflux protein